MKTSAIASIVGLLLFITLSAAAQHHMSNWIIRASADSTLVRCSNDSLTWVEVPPNSMNMMMMPDSMYMRLHQMPLDSLRIAHDSTIIGWCRLDAGRDSMHFTLMDMDSIHGGTSMMQFMRSMLCQFHWDSLMADSVHRRWRLTGLRGWNGSEWTIMTGVSVAGTTARVATAQSYPAVALIGVAATSTGVAESKSGPVTFALFQNYPNPFNPTTKIKFAVPDMAFVTLTVFNALGQRIATLVSETLAAGTYERTWNPGNSPSGVYFYRVTAGQFSATRKLLLLR